MWWARQDLNLGPTDYESAALTAELRALFNDLRSVDDYFNDLHCRFFNSSEPFFNPFHRFHRHLAGSVDVVFPRRQRIVP
jgi:hypothetical protein